MNELLERLKSWAQNVGTKYPYETFPEAGHATDYKASQNTSKSEPSTSKKIGDYLEGLLQPPIKGGPIISNENWEVYTPEGQELLRKWEEAHNPWPTPKKREHAELSQGKSVQMRLQDGRFTPEEYAEGQGGIDPAFGVDDIAGMITRPQAMAALAGKIKPALRTLSKTDTAEKVTAAAAREGSPLVTALGESVQQGVDGALGLKHHLLKKWYQQPTPPGESPSLALRQAFGGFGQKLRSFLDTGDFKISPEYFQARIQAIRQKYPNKNLILAETAADFDGIPSLEGMKVANVRSHPVLQLPDGQRAFGVSYPELNTSVTLLNRDNLAKTLATFDHEALHLVYEGMPTLVELKRGGGGDLIYRLGEMGKKIPGSPTKTQLSFTDLGWKAEKYALENAADLNVSPQAINRAALRNHHGRWGNLTPEMKETHQGIIELAARLKREGLTWEKIKNMPDILAQVTRLGPGAGAMLYRELNRSDTE